MVMSGEGREIIYVEESWTWRLIGEGGGGQTFRWKDNIANDMQEKGL